MNIKRYLQNSRMKIDIDLQRIKEQRKKILMLYGISYI